MKIKKYEVTDMKEALRQIKQDLGPDAVILTTRKVMKPSGLGLFPRPVLEVTAAVEYEKNDIPAAPSKTVRSPVSPPQSPRNPSQVNLSGGIPEIVDPTQYKAPASPYSATMDNDLPPSTRQPAAGNPYGGQMPSAPRPSKSIPEPDYTLDDDDAYLQSLLESTKDYDITSAISGAKADSLLPVGDEEFYKPEKSSPHHGGESNVVEEMSGVGVDKLSELLGSLGLDKISTLAQDIGDIKKQITEMKSSLNEPVSVASVDLPQNLKEFYTLLLKNGLDELLAYRFLKGLERKLPEVPGKAQIRAIVQQELGDQIAVEKDFVSALYKKVTAFLGPTGVGKTTTIAKIAANLVIKYTQRVCLITADNFRIGAVDQLKTYADIVSLPLYVASSPAELGRLLNEVQDEYDYILLDTTGRSPYDNSKLNDIAAYLSVSPDIVPVVVMSMAGNQAEQSELFERYTALDPAYVIFTKLDETRYYGSLANIPIKKKVPLLLLSTGQGVPDDLEIPDGKKIAKKLLQEIPALWKEN